MNKAFQVFLKDLGGGLNEAAASGLQDREMAKLSNFHALGTRLKRRGGRTAVSSVAYANGLSSLFAYKTKLGAWTLLVGLKDGIGKLSGGTVVKLSSEDFASLSDPWKMRQYKDEVFAARPRSGTLKRVTLDAVMDAGIAPPTQAPTISQGAAGAKEAGDRILVFTYYNNITKAESNPSPPSNTLSLGASKQLVADGITASLNPQVNARRLYETSPNQQGEYFFVKQVDDNVQTAGISNDVKQDDLGRSVSFENGPPPDGITAIEVLDERLFAAVGSVVFFSQPYLMQSFSESDFIPIMEDDGHKIVDLVAWSNSLVVPKTGGMYVLTGSGPRTFTPGVISDKHGARGLSTVTAEGVLLWYSGENIYRSDGSTPSALSSLRLRKTLDRINHEAADTVVGTILPRLSLYLLAVPLDDATTPSHVIAYNYKTDAWDLLEESAVPTFFGRFFDVNAEERLYGVYADGLIYELESGTRDAGQPIVAVARTKAMDFGLGPSQKGIATIGVNTTAVNATLKVRVYNDEKDTWVKERTLSLARPGWKRVNISTIGQPASLHQIEFEYSGDPDLELFEVSIEGTLMPTRKPRAA